jgi:glucosamine 6-phosphate synthetase-like amidotransferase/phosphosugar isomerase protein
MCPPIIAAVQAAGTAIAGLSTAAKASLLLGGAQAGMSIVGQRQAAKAQGRAQNRATIAEQQRYLNETSAMRARERQELIAQAQKRQNITTKAREARATARVSAGEAGVAGLSIDALLNSFTQQEAQAQFALTQQAQFRDTNSFFGLQDSELRSTNNLLRINKPIAQPNYLGAVLDGASTGMSAYTGLKNAGIGAGTKATSGTSMKKVASLSQKSKNMGMLDLPQYKSPFNTYG